MVKYYVTEFTNSYAFVKVWGDFSEATPVRKEVDDAVLIHCTGLILFSEHMIDSLVFFAEKCKIIFTAKMHHTPFIEYIERIKYYKYV